jgi:hypothetical protein
MTDIKVEIEVRENISYFRQQKDLGCFFFCKRGFGSQGSVSTVQQECVA